MPLFIIIINENACFIWEKWYNIKRKKEKESPRQQKLEKKRLANTKLLQQRALVDKEWEKKEKY